MFKHLELAGLLLKLRAIWRGVGRRNPITPTKIVTTMKLVYTFITGKALLILLISLLSYFAIGAGVPTQVIPTQEVNYALGTVRVSVGDGSRGHGTLIRPDMVVTCYHLFRDSERGIVVEFPTGEKIGAGLFSIDKTHDLATIVLDRPTSFPQSQVSSSQDLNSLEIFDGRKTTVRDWKRPSVQTADAATLISRGGVPSGYSGGGLYNDGGLYGVIWGSADGETYATSGAKFRGFMARTLSMRGQILTVVTDAEHCVPCQRMMPTLNKLSEEGYLIVGLQPVKGEAIPRLDFWRDNAIVKVLNGYTDEKTIRRYLEYPQQAP